MRKLIDDLLDSGVGATAAEIAAESLANLFLSCIGILVEKGFSCDDKSRGAEAALLSVIFHEGSLHRTELIGLHQTFGGDDGLALRLDGEYGAGVDGLIVHENGAGAAGATIAYTLRTCNLKFFA